MAKQKALIVGAGIAGIATAIRLAVKGYDVEVFEANAYPGGKLSEIETNGYRFDAGPSLFTMPQYVDELFTLADKNPSDYFAYQKLDVVCKYFYPDGTRLNAYAETKAFAKEIEEKTSEPAQALVNFLAYSRDIYSITNHVFLERSLHQLKTFLRWDTVRSILRFPKIDPFRTMHRANESSFKDKRVVQLFDRYATYNGSNPYQAPATLNVIPHLEHHYGAYFPAGGMYSITQNLVKLAEDVSVKFTYNSPVDEIVVINKQVKGLRTKGRDVLGDVVVSNMDVWFTYKKLLKKHEALHPQKILNQERSSSALIFYWGIKKQFPQLDLHNIFFGGDYQAEFDHIWLKKYIYQDPTVYINISSKYKADDAPPGCENWFVMINVPANSGQDWDKLVEKAREDILVKISKELGEDIKPLIACEEILDPRSIESKTSSYQGSLYGTSSNNQFAAFLRHANKSSKVKGLFFCGGSVHPGGGIPLALLSAKIVSPLTP
ncbi:phytoene desaturase [Mucilaginibacter pallidiroseus]|uniref:Phytoene desaturase n=1 Tax=Mucilaginibacter pallidiroseus TaxID=2599295 RepID=A0A563U561_9SPHI|nr:1-hydroxycarotenoid 3,4-desaturase CrtD [Mucilaginibacter pallidiroseus]TWR26481.1 phytoene desaturase [Mucilaginibacter pallidiroseus]